METTEVTVGKYRFRIIENIVERDKRIYNRSFKIGGNYHDCVNVTISYDAQNKPILASIPTLLNDSECSLDAPLDRGEGSILIIKTLLHHIHSKIPSITQFKFEDYSKLECGTEEEKNRKRDRVRGTHAVPVPLYYFSIAFNGVTWYEKHFQAKQSNPEVHKAYREKIYKVCYTPKAKMTFDEFISITTPTLEQIDEIKPYYERASTYNQFFTSIPKERRCPLVRRWINTFMSHILEGAFQHTNWIIDITTMDNPHIELRGGGKKTRRQRIKSYYCPKGRIYHSDTRGELCINDE